MKLRKMRAVYEDERGSIIDIVEDIKIDSVTLITSKKGARRGDHYHKKSVQYTFVLKGTLELLTQMPGGKIETTIIKGGHLVLIPPMESHTLIALEDSEFLALTRGPRGGKNYEKDTYRLAEKLISNNNLKNNKLVVNK